MSLLARANRRHFWRHPMQWLLAVLGVALGVALLISVDLAADSSHRAFALSMEALTGHYTHHIEAGPSGLPEDWYVQLRGEGLYQSAPAVEGFIKYQGQTLRLLGFDPFAERNLQSRFKRAIKSDDSSRLLTETDTVLLSAVTGQRYGLKPGDRFEVKINGTTRQLKILAWIEGELAPDPALEGLVLADIAAAQEWLGRVGLLDRVDLLLAENSPWIAKLTASLPPGATLEPAHNRNQATLQLTAAFELNLRAMSLLALMVGMFLIYNTMAFSVLQRRELLASLRILGATRSQLLREILLEAAGLSLIGGVIGVGLGTAAAQVLLQMVTRTINDLYFVLTVTEFLPDPWLMLRGLLLGMVAALLAAAGPALEAAYSPPIASRARSGAESFTRRSLPWLTLAGLLGLGISLLLLGWGEDADRLAKPEDQGKDLMIAMSGQLLMLLGYGLLTPLLLLGLSGLAVWTARRYNLNLFKLAVLGVSASLSRTGLAIAALSVAVAVSVGEEMMIESFRGTVADWLDQILQADLYIDTPSTIRASPPLPKGLEEKLKPIPELTHIGAGRRVFVTTSVGESELLAIDPPLDSAPGFRFKNADSAKLWQGFPQQRAVFISEPYASKHQLKVGDNLTLPTDLGPVTLLVSGVFYDYRTDQGLIIIHRHLYDQLWKDGRSTSFGLYLKPGADLETVRKAIIKVLASESEPLQIHSNREIRETSLVTFDRTFAITKVLRLLAVGVAFIGILSALLAFQFERRRELAVLRATGLTPGETGALVMLQTGYMGLAAGLLALPLGVAVTVSLIRVINFRSFGWSMNMILNPETLWSPLLLSLLAALLAGLYPARLAMTTPPASNLREE